MKINTSSSFPRLNILSSTSSVKTPSAGNNYHALTGNSVTLTAGTWELTGIVNFGQSGSPTYSDMACGFYGANGADSSSQPATVLSATPNLTINSAYGGPGFLGSYYAPGSAGVNVHTTNAPSVIVTVTANVTVYLVTYSVQATSANARITVYLNARQIK